MASLLYMVFYPYSYLDRSIRLHQLKLAQARERVSVSPVKQFFMILSAILAAAAIIALVVGVYNAKKQNDEFNAKMQQVNGDLQKANADQSQTNN